jgi:hypothetical protein
MRPILARYTLKIGLQIDGFERPMTTDARDDLTDWERGSGAR